MNCPDLWLEAESNKGNPVQTFNAMVFLFDRRTAGLYDMADPARILNLIKRNVGALLPMAEMFERVARELGYEL